MADADITRGRSAATAQNPDLDPARGSSATVDNPLRDPTPRRPAGTLENALHDPTDARPNPTRPAEVTYLSCPRCGLSVRSRNPLTDRAYCPRCGARGLAEPLVRYLHASGRLPHRHSVDTNAAAMNETAHPLRQHTNITGSTG
ncbi:MAG TPA: hypothetical protein VMF14_16420 [Solirubrobacteraceae bacterium]|nr:hypothetical protein [Solirubrobacteraceae bacterium]